MPPITFYPGPSKIYPKVAQYLQDAYDSGILSANHRSQMGMALVEDCIKIVKEKLAIPLPYEVYFFGSATECWQVIAQSLSSQSRSIHFYNGAFGQKWADYSAKLIDDTLPIASQDYNQAFDLVNLRQSLAGQSSNDVLCITQNETANGTQVDMPSLAAIKANNQQLIAVDVTSSIGGIALDWHLADVWFGSVQKCLGLPAGLALMVCSPRAVAQAQTINNRQFYNSLCFVKDNFDQFQTPYTPNMLAIYLLKRVLEDAPTIAEIDHQIKQRATDLYAFFVENPTIGLQALVSNTALRSATVLALQGSQTSVAAIKQLALNAGIILGNGYGLLKDKTVRIANFPAITDAEVERLTSFFKTLA
jgi:phosphoserine aminotransferase